MKEINGMEELGLKIWQGGLRYAGHMMRGSSGGLVQLQLESFFEGKKDQARLKRSLGKDSNEWPDVGQ